MTANTPHVGVRTFLDRADTVPFIIADMSSIGGVFEPVADMDRDYFPPHTPVAFDTNDTTAIEAIGTTGTLKQTVDAIVAEGIVATVVATVPPAWANNASIDTRMAALLGSASSKTGAYSLLEAENETGVAPDILIAPGYTSQRLGNSANPLATAFDGICDRILTAIAVTSTPSSTKEAAAEWAADFGETLNLVAVGQGVRVSVGGVPVVRDAAPSIAALITKTDKALGGPYYNPGNQALKGILGPNRSVSFRISDPDCEANYLIQRGVNSIVQMPGNRTSRRENSPQGKTFWGFFNTSTDADWRAINVVRTRKAVREVIPRTLVKYAGQNLGTHVAVLLLQSLEDFMTQLKSLPEPAILPTSSIRWDAALNDPATLRTGGFAINLNFQEAPPITDIQVYTGTYPKAFTILADEIQRTMTQIGVAGKFAA